MDPNYIINYWSPIHYAANDGYYEIVKLLAKHGADVDDIQNWVFISLF